MIRFKVVLFWQDTWWCLFSAHYSQWHMVSVPGNDSFDHLFCCYLLRLSTVDFLLPLLLINIWRRSLGLCSYPVSPSHFLIYFSIHWWILPARIVTVPYQLFSLSLIPSTFINWNSSVRNSCSFSTVSFSVDLYQYRFMDIYFILWDRCSNGFNFCCWELLSNTVQHSRVHSPFPCL